MRKGLLIPFLISTLAGCGSQEPETPEVKNIEPQVSIAKKTINVDEGTITKIDFSAVDDSTPFEQLKIEFQNQTAGGIFEVDRVSKQIILTAPWLASGSQVVHSADLVVTDAKGASSTTRITATVTDLKNPVTVTVSPPSTGFGFEKTQTPTLLNVFIFEGQDIVVPYLFKDVDGDEINVSISEVTQNKYVYKNDIALVQNQNGTGVDAKFKIPDIEEPSAQFSLGVTVSDNDGQSKATVNFTVINSVKLQWDASAGTTISEQNGASFLYSTSVKAGYQATVTAALKNSNGDVLPISVSVDPVSHIIKVPSLPAFQGSQSATLELTYTTDIKNAAGEVYPAVAKLVRNVALVDDRDDDFNSMKSLFSKQMIWLESLKSREDDVRVSRAVMDMAFMNGWLSEPDLNDHMKQVTQLYRTQVTELLNRGQVISSQLTLASDENKALLQKFSEDFRSIGAGVRKATADKIINLKASLGVTAAWSLPGADSVMNNVKSGTMASHYVGNTAYGRYTDDKQTAWAFSPAYAYMDVADITDSYCY